MSAKETKNSVINFFSSLKLAVVLLIVMAAISIAGTFIPQGQEPAVYLERYGEQTYSLLKLSGLIDLYHSMGFRALTVLLAANLSVCTFRRLGGIYRQTFRPDVEKEALVIRELRISNELPSPERAQVLLDALASKKYRITRSGKHIYAVKGAPGRWGDVITHASILVILLGALVGSFGYVGTINIYEGEYSDQFFNWNTYKDEDMGFRLHVEKFTLEHYPMPLKVKVRERHSGKKVGEFDTREGETFSIPGGSVRVMAQEVDAERREAVLQIFHGDRLVGVYDTGLPDGGEAAPPLFFYSFQLGSFSPTIPKTVSAAVRVTSGGGVKRGIIEANSPLKYGNLAIYHTAYARDPDGRYYAGFQIVRDPGLPLVYAGFALLLAGVTLSFFVHHRQVWIYVGDAAIIIGGTTNKDAPEFMREYGGIIRRFMQELEP